MQEAWTEVGGRLVRSLSTGMAVDLPEVVIVPGLGAPSYVEPWAREIARWTRGTVLDLPGWRPGRLRRRRAPRRPRLGRRTQALVGLRCPRVTDVQWRTVGLLLAFTVAGCAQTAVPEPVEPAAAPTSTTTPTPGGTPTSAASASHDGRLIGRGTVIDEGSGPRLCFMVLRSLPPQCGTGVELVGWRWPEDGVERGGSTTWGAFAVVGSYDSKRFRVEKTVEPAFPDPKGEGEMDFSSPCPEPAGGWRAPDASRATYGAQDEAFGRGARLPGYADAWIDDLGNSAQDPTKVVLNFAVTQDLPGAERAIRRVWGGALCISKAERSHAELTKIQRELKDTPRLLGGGSGFGHVDLMVIWDDGTLQATLDRKYGKGLVRVASALKPYPE